LSLSFSREEGRDTLTLRKERLRLGANDLLTHKGEREENIDTSIVRYAKRREREEALSLTKAVERKKDSAVETISPSEEPFKRSRYSL